MHQCLRTWLAVSLYAVFIGFISGVYAETSDDRLSFQKAVQKALSANPEIAAFKGEIEKAKARKHQAGLYPNPELAFELEGFGGSGPFSGTDNAERTVTLEQEFWVGGKISKSRQIVAEALKNLKWEMASLDQDIRKDVANAYVKVLSAQAAIDIQQNLVGLSEQIHETVKEKADAGKVSPVEAIKAEIELKNNRQTLQTLKRRLVRERKNLASFWGDTVPDFSTVVGSLESLPVLPALHSLTASLWENPDIKRFETEKKYQKARLELARAMGLPDLSVSGGYRQVPETDDDAFIFEIAIPLKIFNRNQGNIEAARLAVKQVDDRQGAAINIRRKQLNAAFQNAIALLDEINALEQEIIPATRKVFSANQEGYQSGKFTFLELLDAQRMMFESQNRYNDAVTDYHLAISEIERLVGHSLNRAHDSEPAAKNMEPAKEIAHDDHK